MTEVVDLIIKNANEIITLKGPDKPRVKEEMNNIGVITKGSIAIEKDKIIAVGRKIPYKSEYTIDATGKTVTPGFIDPHTHLVFSGSREFELELKIKGLSYQEIAERGGGILYTVKQTRRASESSLIEESMQRLKTMITYGTTTCEAKSGYGLDTKTEKKILTIHRKLNERQPVEIISTLLGAHATPPGLTTEEYTRYIIDDMIPATSHLAEFCDVFCEKGYFSYKQTKKILTKAKEHGLLPKIHADELTDTNSAQLAAEIDAVSADHLLKSNNQGLKKMAEKRIIGVLLPAAVLSLNVEYPDARRIITLGVPVALGTDLNPNCYTENMQLVIQLACMKMRMTPAEALCAATFNAACAIKRNKEIGSIEPGKQADILILKCKNHKHIPYHLGVNLVETVIKKGEIIVENK